MMIPIRPSLEESCPKPEGWLTITEAITVTGRTKAKILDAIQRGKIGALMGYWSETVRQEWRIEPDTLKDWSSNGGP